VHSAFPQFLSPKDAGFQLLAQWIIWRHWTLSDYPTRGVRDAGTADFARKGRIFD
jgi:hypothetical protein